jgi:FkbM family methyltransferase
MAGRDVRVAATAEHGPFWDLVADGRWEPGTLEVIERLLSPTSTYVDIGAWIGPTVLWAAATGASVLAFEPDPVAYAELQRNLQLNPELAARVTVHALAVFDREGTLSLSADSRGLGRSVSTLIGQDDAGGAVGVRAADGRRVVGWPEFASCALLKIDVEGAEYRLLRRIAHYLRDQGPPLLLAIHGVHGRSRFGSLPMRPRRAVQFLANAGQRAAALWRLRGYASTAVSDGRSPFRRVSRVECLRLILDQRERDLYLTRRR